MAIKAFTRKTSGPTTSDEFLKDYENLLKRNKGGGTFMGYDTSSQTPIYLGTSVADPTGLGATPISVSNTGAITDYSKVDPSEVDIETLTPEELAQFYYNPNLSDLEKNYIINVLNWMEETSGLIDESTQTNQVADLLNQEASAETQMDSVGNNENIASPVIGPTTRYSGKYARLTDQQISMFTPDVQESVKLLRDVERTQEDADVINKYAGKLNSKIEAERQQKTNEAKKYIPNDLNKAYGEMTGQTPDQIQKNLENSKQAETWNDIPEGFEMNAEGTGIVRKKESNDMGSAINELLSFIGNKAGEGIKNVRGAVGDTIDSLAYAIPGTSNRKDTRFSEWVAGRDTPHTVSAAEPETAQAGSGLTRLRDDMSYSPNALAGRPDFSQIGLKRSIGNVAGIQDQSAITGNKQVSPDGQSIMGVSRFSQSTTPTSTTLPKFNPQQQESRPSRTFDQSQLGSIVDAMMSKGYNNRAEAEAVARADINRFGNEYLPSGGSSNNVGVGSNQPQTQQSGQQSSNNTSRANTYTAPTTSNNAMTYSNLSNIGTPNFVMPTVGVGSNQPSTSSSSSNSNSLMSTISNILSNLFRRK